MPKTVISVGAAIPGGDVEMLPLTSNRSLLDADIVLFCPGMPSFELGYFGRETYQGKLCLSDDASFRSKEALNHWRRELAAAIDSGKLVVVLLSEPAIVFAATGENQQSGTGRNARITRIVGELSSYSALPVSWKYQSASGRSMALVAEARYLTAYWHEFGMHSTYEVYIEGSGGEPTIRTKTGGRVVGACLRKGRGALLALPSIAFDAPSFTETKIVEKQEKKFWTKKAQIFGKKFVSALVSMADALAAETQETPVPDWALADIYRIPAQANIEAKISHASEEIAVLEETRRELNSKLKEAGVLRGLLFEQGRALEHAVLRALGLMGFTVSNLKENGSEFDAVFTSPEGRFLGEVEGKDKKAINIDKFSQLERNLSEDFARDEVSEHAKGVLFGNAHRLEPPESRGGQFTDKCKTWPAAGSADTELGVLMEPEVGHGEAEVYTRVQA